MKIKANLIRSPASLRSSQCEVEKVVELPSLDFSEFLAEPLARSDIIAENQELMYQWNEVDYCLLVLDKDGRDGVLVNTAGSISNNYAAYVPEARSIVQAKLDQAADWLVQCTVVCHPGFCSNTCFSFSAQEENPSGDSGPQLQM